MKFCVLLPFKGEKWKSRAVVDEVLTVRRSPDDYLSKSARLLLHTYLSNPPRATGLYQCTGAAWLFFFIVKNKNKSRCFGLFFFLFKETFPPLPVKKVFFFCFFFFFFIVVPLEFVKESARPAAVLITRVRKWLACCCGFILWEKKAPIGLQKSKKQEREKKRKMMNQVVECGRRW